DDVVDFLAENAKVPNRYRRDKKGDWVLADVYAQFPIMPQTPGQPEHVNPVREYPGYFDSFHCCWAWHSYAQEPLPPIEYGRPFGDLVNPDPLRYRRARSPAPIIFRQQPARGLAYIAERLQKESWFDDSGWPLRIYLDDNKRLQWEDLSVTVERDAVSIAMG